jgi:G3E family GTPase
MKVVQIAGYLGSGKTTLIVTLGRNLALGGYKVAILVNEVGAVPVDGKVIQEFGLTVKDIGGGCICCQVAGNLLLTLKSLSANIKPDYVVIEPTGMAVPNSVRDVIKPAAHKLNVVMGPIIVLLDTSRFEKLLGYESIKRLIATQLKDADIIALSKIDAVPAEKQTAAKEAAREINPSARVIGLSTFKEMGISDVITAIHEVTIQ